MHPLLRFTLDVFEVNQPLALADNGQDATQSRAKNKPSKAPNAASLSPQTGAGIAQISFRHPRANREVQLGPVRVAYEFNRGQRRSIGFSVGADGLAVRAPKWLALREVDAALQAKSDWILRKLQETRERHARLADHVIEWRDGAELPFLGQTLRIRLDPEHRHGAGLTQLVTVSPASDGSAGTAAPPMLHIRLAHSATPEQIRDAVQAWLMRQARQIFLQRLDHFAGLLGVHWKKLSLSNAGTRWGSARHDGAIRLNWRLVHFSMSVLDYVVAHELSHLREMNHSAKFWDTVRTVVPDYVALRQQLKNQAVPKWR
jgi:predicted metal-dependent hydrolase